MGGELESIGMAEARSALAWWLEAGVDVAMQEEPRDWLKPPATAGRTRAEPAAPAECRSAVATRPSPPSEWLASSTKLPLASATARRIMPHGPENAAIMLLSEAPTLEDFAAGQPIGGESWELTKRMLAAIKIVRRPGLQRVAVLFPRPRCADEPGGARSLRGNRPQAHQACPAGAAAAARRWPGASTARQAARAGTRPCLQGRGRAHRRDLPSAPSD